MDEKMDIVNAIFGQVNVTSGFDTTTNLFGILFLVVIGAIICMALLYAAQSYEKFKKFKRIMSIFKILYKSLNYFAYGSLTIIVIGGPAILGYYSLEYGVANSESIYPLLRIIGIGIGAYTIIALVGYATKKRIWKRLFKFREMEKESNFASWSKREIG
jgi:hypothetical protein